MDNFTGRLMLDRGHPMEDVNKLYYIEFYYMEFYYKQDSTKLDIRIESVSHHKFECQVLWDVLFFVNPDEKEFYGGEFNYVIFHYGGSY